MVIYYSVMKAGESIQECEKIIGIPGYRLVTKEYIPMQSIDWPSVSLRRPIFLEKEGIHFGKVFYGVVNV